MVIRYIAVIAVFVSVIEIKTAITNESFLRW